MHKSNVNVMEQVVLGTILSFPNGATQDDIVNVLSSRYPGSNFTARVTALKHKNLVVETGQKRAGSTGRNQRVLKATLLSAQQ